MNFFILQTYKQLKQSNEKPHDVKIFCVCKNRSLFEIFAFCLLAPSATPHFLRMEAADGSTEIPTGSLAAQYEIQERITKR